MSKYWRPLTQEEIAGLGEGDALLIRQSYLLNPERRPVTYVEATYLAKVKSAVIQILEKGSDTAICVGLTEVGRLYDDGWHMTPEEWEKIKSGDPVIIHQDSGECRPARFVTGAHFLLRKSFLKARPNFRRWRQERLDRSNETPGNPYMEPISDIEKQQKPKNLQLHLPAHPMSRWQKPTLSGQRKRLPETRGDHTRGLYRNYIRAKNVISHFSGEICNAGGGAAKLRCLRRLFPYRIASV